MLLKTKTNKQHNLMKSFTAKIEIIGVNPFVFVPQKILENLIKKIRKNKIAIPVKGTLNGNDFTQTLVNYSGEWRLYVNTPMRKQAGIDVGDIANFTIEYDRKPFIYFMSDKLECALDENKKAKDVFFKLNASSQKKIIRYLSILKTEEAIDRTINKVIQELLEKEH